jgi:hypothetical protein
VNSQSPINGGYFVVKSKFLDSILDDPTIELEKSPLYSIVNRRDFYV